MVLRPTTPLAIEGLSIRIGLAVAAALDSVLPIGASVQLKWPNDLFGQNRKLGGVLCEARWIGERLGWVVAGVGINVANGIGPDLALGAVRLVDLGGPANPEGLERLVGDVVDEASALGGMLSDHELKAFARRDWLLGRRILGPVSGIAAGLQADGRLLVRQPDGTSQAVFGPVVVGDLAQPRPSH